jgi:ATP-binding cassette, subfamily B, bacterial MsbA
MQNFSRVLRLTLRYRGTVAGSIVTALLVAALWAANIGAAFPVVKVAIQGQTLQGWVREEIRQADERIAEQQTRLASLRIRAAESSDRGAAIPAEVEKGIRDAENTIAVERAAAERYGWLRPYVDRYVPAAPFPTLVLLTVALLLGTVVKDLFIVLNNVLVARLSQLATFDLRKTFFRRTLRMDLGAFGDEGTSDLMSRFTHDSECVSQGLNALFGKLVREPLKMIACLVGAALVCWRLLVLSLVVAPLAAWLIQRLGRTLKRANRRAMEEMASLYNTLEETFRGIKIIKAFTGERHHRRLFHEGSKGYFKKAMRIAAYDSLSHPLTELLGVVAISIAVLVGAYLVIEGRTRLLGVTISPRPLSVPSLLLFYAFLAGMADPLRKFSDVFNRIQRAVAAGDRIFALLDRKAQVEDPARPVTVPRHHRDIVFDGVTFAYRAGQPVLEEIDLRIAFGETIAVVGPNGCGKTTLANLIPRFYDPTQGEVRLDGVPLGSMRLRDLRRQIGLVAQETVLFDDTVLNNIRYGSPQATREDVIRAARQAHAHDFITRELPDGYETMVGALGGKLSGGQRQRIALARAILRDPAVIILDEATSQIDLESEQAIHEVLVEFVRNRTAIVITHRLATLALADRIVVMQGGRILDVGTHGELLARCALYRRLHQIHFDAQADGSQGAAA